MKKQLCYFILPISLLSAASFLKAEISTDGSVGPQVLISGPNFQISEDLGSRTGDNLYHSFNTFNIFQGESAVFTGSSDIANVISRVTGGEASTIDGLLQSQIGTADFYFINPTGILFGQNAQIDVPSSFHASTADALNFSDGSQFNAIDPSASSLSVATPSSFGFTDRQTAKIIMDGSVLSLNEEKHLSLTASEIEANNAQLFSQSGTVSVVAVGEQDTTLHLDKPLLEQAELNAEGDLSLSNSQIDVSGNGGGQINIAAGETSLIVSDLFNTNDGSDNNVQETNITVQSLNMDNAWIKNDSNASGQSPSINVVVENDMAMQFGSILSSSSFATGNAGQVTVEAKNLLIDRNGSEFLTGIVSNANTNSSGNAGTVDVFVLENLDIVNQAEIGSNTFADGNAGEVFIQAGNLYIDGKNADGLTGISSQAVSNSTGNAGSVDIKIADKIEIFDRGVISSSTFSAGNAGNINIETNSLYINRFNADSPTGILSNATGNSSGNAGDIKINASDWVAVTDGGKISSSTFAQGDAGGIELSAKQLFLHDNDSAYITAIVSDAEEGSLGNAGQLDINISEITEIYAGAFLGSNTSSQGNAGTVNLNSGEIIIDDLGANIFTGIASETTSTGYAGEVNIKASGKFTLQSGGEISTNTFGEGNAGTINIQAGQLLIDRQDSEVITGIVSNSIGLGHAGSVNIIVDEKADIINGGQIASSAFDSGDAGEVNVTADAITIDRKDHDSITGIFSNAQSGSLGEAGTVTVKAAGLLEVLNGGKIVSNTSSIGDAGIIFIQAGDLYLDKQGSDFFTGITSNAEFGSTGNAGAVFVDASGLISIFSGVEVGSNTFGDGDAGEVTVNTQQLLIDAGNTTSLTGIFSDVAEGAKGNGGVLNVTVSENAVLQNGGKIASNTYSTDNAGDIKFTAKNLTIDGQDYPFATGITSIAKEDSVGNAGSVDINVAETINIVDGGEISTNTLGEGNAGFIQVKAKNVNIDRQDNNRFTGIFSDAEEGSFGHAGSIKVTVTDTLNVINGAWLSSSTNANGNAGDIEIISDSVTLDANNTKILTGVFSNAEQDSLGKAGSITISNNNLISILNGASISSNTKSIGDAGSVSLTTKNMDINPGTSGIITGISSDAATLSSGNAGSLEINVTSLLNILNGASISSNTFGLGNAGDIEILAGDINIDRQGNFATGIFSNTQSTGNGNAGSIDINVVDMLNILNGGKISSDTFSKGHAGIIKLAVGNLTIDQLDSGLITGIFSDAKTGSNGNAGVLNITISDSGILKNGGQIASNTFGQGNAGEILISANNLLLDYQEENPNNFSRFSGIFSDAKIDSNGDAGTINIRLSNLLQIIGNSSISSNTYSIGNAGNIDISSQAILIDGTGSIFSDEIFSDDLEFATGIASDAKYGSTGDAGTIQIANSGNMLLTSGTSISSDTHSTGNAGDIKISSNQLDLDGNNSVVLTKISSSAAEGSIGDAGNLFIEVNDSITLDDSSIASDVLLSSVGNAGSINIQAGGSLALINGGFISSSTFGLGNSGDISVISNDLLIDTKGSVFSTGIYTDSFSSELGNAGSISVLSHNQVDLLNGGSISSNTGSQGDAGVIDINAKTINIDRQGAQINTGIFSDAKTQSEGNAGSINIHASEKLNIFNGGKISSNTFSIGNAGVIEVAAGHLTIDQLESGLFTGIFSDAKTDSQGNAGSININVTGTVTMNHARVTSNTGENSSGHAGKITINADDKIILKDSSEIGSNTNAKGDAGEIIVTTKVLTIDGKDSEFRNGIFSNAETGSIGNAGSINITASELLEVLNGSDIASNTSALGDAGDIKINAHDVILDGQDSAFANTISSKASSLSSGNAGEIQFIISGNLDILDGSKISTDTFGKGDAGNIKISANSINIDRKDSFITGISSNTQSTEDGNAGSIDISVAENLNIINGGEISSNTYSPGYAGVIDIKAKTINLDRQGADSFTGIFSDAKSNSGGNAGSIQVEAQESLNIVDGAWISSNTEALGDAGDIQVTTNLLTLDAQDSGIITGVLSNAKETSSGDAGTITINTSGLTKILGGAEISSNTLAAGDAGEIQVTAQQLLIDTDDSTFFTGIFSNAEENALGNAGQLSLHIAESLVLLDGGKITTSTYAIGNAGDIEITANNVTIDRQGGFTTGIFSDANTNSQGNAGTIKINAPGLIEILDGGTISSNTESLGSAGDIEIISGSLQVDSNNSGILTGVFSNAKAESQGNAGSIKITNQDLIEVYAGAQISSNTASVGKAGSVEIFSQDMLLDSQKSDFLTGISTNADEGSSGNAGQISIDVSGTLKVFDGTEIGSNTKASGHAGNVNIHAGNLIIDSKNSGFFTGIGSDTFGDGSGNAGEINVIVDNILEIVQTGTISSTSRTAGNAGEIFIKAGELIIDAQNSRFSSITSESFDDSTGQVGNIEIVAEKISLNNTAQISIGSFGNLENVIEQDHFINISANEITLDNGSKINAESTGNSPAASIFVTTTGNLNLNNVSSITTASEISDGGPITINSGLVSLEQSLITTSVTGQQGNGGNISVSTPALVMKTGFIQANTAAAGASGGDILIDTPQLIFPSNQEFLTNQNERITFDPNGSQNVIQAAAPDGVSGNVTVTAPTLDISSSILNISTRFSDQTKIRKNPCKVSAGEIPSSLTWAGQGGLPSSHSDSISLPLGKRLRSEEASPKNKNDQSFNKLDPKDDLKSVPNTPKSKLGCVASVY